MKVIRKRWMQAVTVCVCVLALLCPMITAKATDLSTMESESAGLQNKIDSINDELLEIGNQIAENEIQIETVNGEIAKTQEQLAIARKAEEEQHKDMQLRIRYIYENSGESLFGMILTAEDLTDFVNKVDFVKTMNEYDRNMVNELQELRETIEEEEEHLKTQQEEYIALEADLNAKKEELDAKAKAAQADLNALTAKIQELKAAEAARAAAAQAAAAQAAAAAQGGSSGAGESGGTSSSAGVSSGGGYAYPSGSGQLNPRVGVVYFNGHKETYYSQKVLPGGGLRIPGRHVASDGTVRDGNGYLCLASSDHPKGTVVETSLGTGIVYDTGCASGVIDIYTDW